MARASTKVTQHGRVTIPADVRRDLELEAGDYVVIDVEPLGDD
jgi:AbrB family looped-hinge helix DNA binding protein